MIPARQSTALELAIGPVLDADGVAVTGCVVGDFKIKKTTGNFAALNGSATLTHVSAGVYDLVLTTSDVDTVGLATIAIDDTVNACASIYLQVIEEAVYDRDFAASATGIIGVAQTADNNTILASGTYGLSALKTLLDAIGAKTTNLPSDPADQSELAASLTSILNAINSANYAQTRFRFSIPEGVEVPESGSNAYVLGITTYNASGVLTDLDAPPTITSFYADGTSAAALFGSVSNVGTGQYNITLTIASGTVANKFVRVVGTGDMVGQALGMSDYVWIMNEVSPDFSSTDRTKLEAIHGKLPSKSYLAGTSNSDGDVQLDEATGTVARVTLVDTTTTNTDMRGTNNAMLAASYTAPPTTVEIVASMTGDSITPAKANELLAAFIAGKVSASSSGGITTYTYKRRDGTTTSFTSACSETDGTRASTGTIP